MEQLKREDFNDVILSGEVSLIFFYKAYHSISTLSLESIREVDQLIGKSFKTYSVDVDLEPEICDALSIQHAPEFICIKNSKVHKRATGFLYSNQILDLLK